MLSDTQNKASKLRRKEIYKTEIGVEKVDWALKKKRLKKNG